MKKQIEINTNEEPFQASILTKEHSPRDSQDDKIFPKHFEVIPKILEYPFKIKREKH